MTPTRKGDILFKLQQEVGLGGLKIITGPVIHKGDHPTYRIQLQEVQKDYQAPQPDAGAQDGSTPDAGTLDAVKIKETIVGRALALSTTPGEITHEIIAYLAEQSSKENPQTIAQIAAGIETNIKERTDKKTPVAKTIQTMLGLNSSKRTLADLLKPDGLGGLRIISEKARVQGKTQKRQVWHYHIELIESSAPNTNNDEQIIVSEKKLSTPQKIIMHLSDLEEGEYLSRTQLADRTASSYKSMGNAIAIARGILKSNGSGKIIDMTPSKDLGLRGKEGYYRIENIATSTAAPEEETPEEEKENTATDTE